MAAWEPKFEIMARAANLPPHAVMALSSGDLSRLDRELDSDRFVREPLIRVARRIIAELEAVRNDAAQGGTKLSPDEATELEFMLARAAKILVMLDADVSENNFVARYLRTATSAELKVSDELAELDRKHGNKPTPAA